MQGASQGPKQTNVLVVLTKRSAARFKTVQNRAKRQLRYYSFNKSAHMFRGNKTTQSLSQIALQKSSTNLSNKKGEETPRQRNGCSYHFTIRAREKARIVLITVYSAALEDVISGYNLFASMKEIEPGKLHFAHGPLMTATQKSQVKLRTFKKRLIQTAVYYICMLQFNVMLCRRPDQKEITTVIHELE